MIVQLAVFSALAGSDPTSGFSETAEYVAKMRKECRATLDLRNFENDLAQARSELCRLAEECSKANWDGFGADPVRHDTYLYAYRLLENLPLGIKAPTVGADPDGELTLEWHFAPRRTLSVSVSEDGLLHYAALIGPNKTYGTEAFLGELPQIIATLIQRIQLA